MGLEANAIGTESSTEVQRAGDPAAPQQDQRGERLRETGARPGRATTDRPNGPGDTPRFGECDIVDLVRAFRIGRAESRGEPSERDDEQGEPGGAEQHEHVEHQPATAP